jgi:hypothetical protein
MAQFNIPGQSLSYTIPDEGKVYRDAGNPAQVLKRVGGTIYTLPTTKYTGDANSLENFNAASGEVQRALGMIGGGGPLFGIGTEDMFMPSIPKTGEVFTMSPSATTPLGAQVTDSSGKVIFNSQTQNSTGQTPQQVQQQVAATTQAMTPQQSAAAVAADGGVPAVPNQQNMAPQGAPVQGASQWYGQAPAGSGQTAQPVQPVGTKPATPAQAGTPATPAAGTSVNMNDVNAQVAKTKAMLAQTAAEGTRPFAGSAWDTPEHNAVGTGLQEAGVSVDPTAASTLAQSNPLKFVSDLFTSLYNSTNMGGIKNQFTEYTKTLNELKDKKNEEIAEANNNPWLSESMRANTVKKIESSYAGEIQNATDQAQLMETMYKDNLAQAQYLTGQAVSVFNNMFDAQSTLALKQMEMAATKAENEAKLESDERIAGMKSKDETTGAPTSYKEWALAGKPGTYASWLKEQSVKAPTVAQQTVAEYASRLEQSIPTIESLQSSISGMNVASFEAQTRMWSAFQSPEVQQYMQAARNFINAKLRRESGAVISPTEFTEARQQYLPQPGDSIETLSLKKKNRDLVYNQLKSAAGPAYQSVKQLLGEDSQQSSTSPFDYLAKDLKINSKTKTASIPRSVWAEVKDKDGLLADVKSDGYTLLIDN